MNIGLVFPYQDDPGVVRAYIIRRGQDDDFKAALEEFEEVYLKAIEDDDGVNDPPTIEQFLEDKGFEPCTTEKFYLDY